MENKSFSFQVIETLKTLCKCHIKHEGILTKIAEICSKFPLKYGILQGEIMDCFYELGFDNANIDEFLSQIKDNKVRRNPETIFKLLMFWAARGNFAWNEEFEAVFNQMVNSNRQFKIQKASDLNLFYQFLGQQKVDLSEKFKNFTRKHHYTLENPYTHIKLSEESVQVKPF